MAHLDQIAYEMMAFIDGNIATNKSTEFLYELCKLQGSSEDCIEATGAELNQPTQHSTYHKNANQLMADYQTRIEEHFLEKGYSVIPSIAKKESKGGHKSTYYLTLSRVRSETIHDLKNQAEYLVPENGIRYHINLQSKSGKTVFPASINMQGWLKALFILMVVAPVVAFVIIVLSGAADLSPGGKNIIYSGAVIALIYAASIPYIALAFSSIYLRKFTLRLNSIVCLVTARENGEYLNYRQIVFRQYEAKCGICDGNIILNERGSLFSQKQLVGECKENSTGHVYSFDHVTNTGKYIGI